MRALPASLEQVQKSPSARAYVRVRVRELVASAPRPRWVRVYSGGEADEVSGIAIGGDGSLIRVRIQSATLYRQRVVGPGAGSDFSVWTSWRAGSRLCAVAAAGSELRAFTVDDATPTQIYEAVSSDNGATWAAWALLETAAGTVATLAAVAKGDGTFLLVWSVGATLYKKKRSGGSWGAAAAWPNTVNGITGVAVAYRNDWNIVVTGTEATTANPAVWQLIYGDGYSQAADTWSGLTGVRPASAGSNVVYDSPSLATDGGREWLTFGENYTGTGGYNRNWWSHNIGDFVNGAWREPVPFNQTNNNQLGLAFAPSTGSGNVWLWAATPYGVWRADISAPLLELTDDLIGFNLEEGLYSASATLVLDNASGKLDAPGSGAMSQVRLGSEVLLDPGYRRPGEAPGTLGGIRLCITGWDQVEKPGMKQLVVRAAGAWEILSAVRPRSSFQWTAGSRSVAQIAAKLLALAGFDYGLLSNSGALTSLQPAFTMHPGEPVQVALRRLLEKVEDRVRFDGGSAVGVWPQVSDGSVYSYGDGHAILSSSLGVRCPTDNYMQALAGGVLGEAVDWESVLDVYARVGVSRAASGATEAEVDGLAAAELRDSFLETAPGAITVRANVGQEVYDVVSVKGVLRRVMGIRWEYAKAPARFEQRLTLGAV